MLKFTPRLCRERQGKLKDNIDLIEPRILQINFYFSTHLRYERIYLFWPC